MGKVVNNKNNCDAKNKKKKKSFFKEKKIRSRVNLKRCVENSNGKCKNCGSSNNVYAHHIIFRSQNGDDSLENLISLCLDCHRKAHDGFIYNNKYVSPISFIISVLESINCELYNRLLERIKNNEI